MGADPGKAETEAEGGGGSESDGAEAGIGVRNLDSVVKVYALHNEPNWAQPWQRKRQEASTSSAFVVRTPARTRALITNAHAVEFASMVKVRARGRDEKHVASVAGLAPDADLALLSVSSSDFWEDSMEPLELAGLPQLQSKILAVGFPIGGESLAVTSGVVSRVEVIPYQHGGQQLLAVQADSAINAGNSGGPAVDSEGRCRGVAFQSLKEESAQNIGYIIPTHVVEHFLADVFENHAFYCYYPILGVELQCMESPHLRQAKKMEKGQKGVLLQRIEPTLPVASHLQKGDVLLSFDETPIGNDASIAFRNGERIHFSYLVSSKFHNETAKVDILRDGQMHSLDIPLSRPKRLVPSHMNDVSPKYFVVGSFVFTTLSAPYLRSCYGKDYELDSPVRLVDKLMHGMAQQEGEEVVVLSQVLGDETALGYEDHSNLVCTRVNNTVFKNLAELAQIVDHSEDEYLWFDLDDNATQSIVLRRKEAFDATQAVLDFHGIPSDRSSNLRG